MSSIENKPSQSQQPHQEGQAEAREKKLAKSMLSMLGKTAVIGIKIIKNANPSTIRQTKTIQRLEETRLDNKETRQRNAATKTLSQDQRVKQLELEQSFKHKLKVKKSIDLSDKSNEKTQAETEIQTHNEDAKWLAGEVRDLAWSTARKLAEAGIEPNLRYEFNRTRGGNYEDTIRNKISKHAILQTRTTGYGWNLIRPDYRRAVPQGLILNTDGDLILYRGWRNMDFKNLELTPQHIIGEAPDSMLILEDWEQSPSDFIEFNENNEPILTDKISPALSLAVIESQIV